MAAIIPVIVQLLPLLVQIPGDITALVDWINSIRTAAQQSGEWTADAEAAYRASIVLDYKAPEQQPDPAPTLTAAQQKMVEQQVSAANAFSSAR